LFNFSLPLLNRLEISAIISITTFLDALNNFPLLSHFKYSLSGPDTNGVDGSMLPVFPHLSSLAGSTVALCFVTLPSLRELQLPSFSKIDHVQQFLTRSSCTVGRFVLTWEGPDEDVDGERLRLWLTAFPSLSVLCIEKYINVDILIDCLDLNSESLAPHLSEITIASTVHARTINYDYGPLVSLLRSRTSPHRSVKLRKFHMVLNNDWYKGVPPYVYEPHLWTPSGLSESALNDLIADGLDLFLEIRSFGPKDLIVRWPPAYIDSESSLPFHS
jgi:hypothetical protein